METSKVNQLLEGQTTFAKEENGLEIHYVLPQEERQDRERGFRVFSIGQPADRPTRCILLLGETGAGKTTFINAAINYLFGVRFKDPFRLRVKEENEDNRMVTESQTDLITAYTINYREGMKHKYNFVLIDTPGMADTRGAQQQEDIRYCLQDFLTTDFGVHELNCVGLVAKANINRNSDSQKAVLGEVISLLGNTVPEITHIFATFAVDEPIVDDVMKNAGVPFRSAFQFDNGALFSSQLTSPMVSFRWDAMSKQYETFIDSLISVLPSVSLKLLREKKMVDICKKNLKTQLEKLATSITVMETAQKKYLQYKLEAAETEQWVQDETVERLNIVPLKDGMHAHNCYSCKQTCIYPCKNVGSNLQAGLTGGASAAAAGAIANLATNTLVTASSPGLVASIGSMAARTLGGAIAGVGTVGTAGLATSLAVTGALGIGGIGLGLATKAVYNKMTDSCSVVDYESVCGKDGCTHSLSQHEKEGRIIMKKNEVFKIFDVDMKELHDLAISEKLDANAEINDSRQEISSCRREISRITVELLCHFKIIQELTSQDSDYIEDVSCQLVNEIRLGEPDIIPYAVKHVNILKEAMRKLVSCTTEEILGKDELVVEMLISIYRDH